jgi:TonB-linked SusC/RagA family outer membrane protein
MIKSNFLKKVNEWKRTAYLCVVLLSFCSTMALAQSTAITGTVTDESGEALIGVSVFVKGTPSIGASTNVNGAFSLSQVPPQSTLVFTYLGYITQEIAVNNRTVINVQLREDVQLLDEVVVVGYGTLQRRDVTGSVGQVQSSAIEGLAAPRIDQALIGQLAGVQVISTTGQPGEGLNIRIRGVGSISAGGSPLYVVDGYPEANISMINPNDIETIDILKDASATAIYGSRGANGVVLITTKRGKTGQARITFDAYYGWQQALRFPEYLTMMEQAQYYYYGIINENLDAGRDVSGHPSTWPANYSQMPRTIMDVLDGKITQSHNAYDYVYRTAPQQNYSISAQGGNDNIKYSVSGSYFSQEGIVIETNFNRYTVRANLDAQLNRRVSMRFSMNSSYSTRKTLQGSGGAAGAEGIVGAADTWMPWLPLFNEDGSYFNAFGTTDASNNVTNPVAQANEIMRRGTEYRTGGNLATTIVITDNLNLESRVGATNNSSRSYYFIPDIPIISGGITPEGGDSRSMALNWITETMLHYNKSFGKHNIIGLAGYTTQKNSSSSLNLSSRNYPNNFVHTLNVVGNRFHEGGSNESEWSLISYLARANYNYDSKYYLTASIRADGSSRFGRDRKYGYFPSASVMWRASEEDFIKDIDPISDLRLRVSYGASGNNNIGNYAHLATVTNPFHVIGGVGMAPSNLENTLLTWEKQNSFNFGLETGFFRNRINLGVEHFITKNHQLLLDVAVPQITGFNTSLQNIGEVENRGWEFTLRTHNVRGRVNWHTNFNLSTFRNKVLKLGPEGAPLLNPSSNPTHITQIGQPMGMFYGYITDGVFKNQAELDAGPIWGGSGASQSRVGDIRFKDISGPDGVPDGKITPEYDKTIIGSPYPDFYFGITNSVSYRNLLLSVAITGSYGNEVMYQEDYKLYTRARYKQYASVRDYWRSESEPGNGTEPRPNNNPKGGLRERSDRFLDDGSFLRVNNINLNYTVPARLVQHLHISNLRLYLTATNPFLFTKYKDMNPEVSNLSDPLRPGIANYNYPTAKSFILGINVTF